MDILKQDLLDALTNVSKLQDVVSVDKLCCYLHLLQKWNRVHSLTAITKPEDMVLKHICDSLSIRILILGEQILDVASGAGLPGIPLALSYAHKNFVLVERNAKKAAFLREAKRVLNLDNVTVENVSVEQYHPNIRFDTIVARAWTRLLPMLQKTRHLAAPNGQFLAMKGAVPLDELVEIHSEFKYSVEPLQISGLDAQRHCIVVHYPNENTYHG